MSPHCSESSVVDPVCTDVGHRPCAQFDRRRNRKVAQGTYSGVVTDTQPDSIEPIISAWRSELDGRGSVPASDVQDRLLDLWGHLPEGDVRSEIERWITETLARHLYQAEDIDARLERVLADA